MRHCATLLLAALSGCAQGRPSYLLECVGSQVFEWPQMTARSLTTLYYRIDEDRRSVFSRSNSGQFNNACHVSCERMDFGVDAIDWVDASFDGEGRSTRIASHYARGSGELTIRTESRLDSTFSSEETLHGEGHFHCRTVGAVPRSAGPST